MGGEEWGRISVCFQTLFRGFYDASITAANGFGVHADEALEDRLLHAPARQSPVRAGRAPAWERRDGCRHFSTAKATHASQQQAASPWVRSEGRRERGSAGCSSNDMAMRSDRQSQHSTFFEAQRRSTRHVGKQSVSLTAGADGRPTRPLNSARKYNNDACCPELSRAELAPTHRNARAVGFAWLPASQPATSGHEHAHLGLHALQPWVQQGTWRRRIE